MFCIVKLHTKVSLWSGFFPIKSYLQHCVWVMFCLLLSAKCYGESSFIQTETLLCKVLQLVLFLLLLLLFFFFSQQTPSLATFHGPGRFPAEDISVPFPDLTIYIFVYVKYFILETLNAADLCRFLIPKTEVNVFHILCLACMQPAQLS